MNKDVVVSRLLSFATAMVFVIMVYLLTVMIVPVEYVEHSDWLSVKNMDFYTRVGIANFIGFALVVYSVFSIKQNKELRQGLLFGSSLLLVLTLGLLIPVTGSDYLATRSWMLLGNFVFVSVLTHEYIKMHKLT